MTGPGPRGLGGKQVEGRRAVRELLVAGRRRARFVWLAEGLQASPILEEIAAAARERSVRLDVVSKERVGRQARTESHQGVLAQADPLPEVSLEQLCHRGLGRASPFLVALDGVTDPQNLGAILRSAECAGASGAVLSRHRAVHVTPAAAKAAAGAIEYLDFAIVAGIPAGLSELRRRDVWTVGLDSDAELSLFELDIGARPVALVLGGEERGLSRLARERCDVVAAITQGGSIPSLNVSAAGAVACFEVARRRRRGV